MKLAIEQTRIIKGIAILMMVYLHLFIYISEVNLCTYFIFVGDDPLVHWLTRAVNPVPFYLFLSGYGLYSTWQSGKDIKPWSRCLNLYRIYWISLLFMIGLSYYMGETNYFENTESIIPKFRNKIRKSTKIEKPNT